MDFAKDTEIRYAEDILLKGKGTFDEEKEAIIRCNESCDIIACPGSGKTTTLLAKLAILARRMPLQDGKGICVLTHTNVAIDEIKSRLHSQADVLFEYPNYFGTIQGFVDKFLAIPYYNSTHPNSLIVIDDDRAKLSFDKYYYNLSPHYLEAAKKYLGRNDRDIDVQDFLFKAYYDVESKKFYNKYKKYVERNPIVQDQNSTTYKTLDATRGNCIQDGILKYDDAYAFAKAYCNQFQDMKESIAMRFSYLFIDEMQDISRMQLDIIDKMFDRNKLVIQRFGDPMQAIYNDDDEGNWEPTAESLTISKSMRFGPNIASVLNNFSSSSNEGNMNIKSLRPIMIVYNDPKDVLHKFAEIVRTKKVDDKTILEIAKEAQENDPLHRHQIMAIGWVGNKRDHDNRTLISSYFEAYDKKIETDKIKNPERLCDFMRKIDKNSVKYYSDQIFSALAFLLNLLDVAYVSGNGSEKYTKARLQSYMSENHAKEYVELREKIAEWSLDIANSTSMVDKKTFDELKSYIEGGFKQMFGYETNGERYSNFIQPDKLPYGNIEDSSICQNIYKEDDVEIGVGTVHSVKGETHIATLYMETSYYRKCESEYIFNQLTGMPHGEIQGNAKKASHVAYVAMSRPRYLLSMAVKKEHFAALNDGLFAVQGWDIEEI